MIELKWVHGGLEEGMWASPGGSWKMGKSMRMDWPCRPRGPFMASWARKFLEGCGVSGGADWQTTQESQRVGRKFKAWLSHFLTVQVIPRELSDLSLGFPIYSNKAELPGLSWGYMVTHVSPLTADEWVMMTGMGVGALQEGALTADGRAVMRVGLGLGSVPPAALLCWGPGRKRPLP